MPPPPPPPIPDNRVFRVLLPFGVPFGDDVIPPGAFVSSGPQSKLAISDITCPFLGTSESTLHVSSIIHLSTCIVDSVIALWIKILELHA